ncbi:cytochrome c1 [Lichenihabitans sp. PAMC28606]|uniref:cytochrome c1 n=1 Tax=Lichenihabitans sp. PAMC28606 TaxID=2880932 RepID=UPI001D0BC230|nr:cytochrome c1 [Lichenihabitans sp. PAMC28606]UDL93039.1 cytochrome c1 [Lichenihabitans sp. PAMC28606]
MIFKTPLLLRTAVLAGLLVGALPALAQEAETPTPAKQSWSFGGPFGKFDPAQLQRGYQVYREVCSNCHSMHYMSFRNLSQPGGPAFSDSQVKALASTFKVQDGPNDAGDMFDRPGRPSDPFPLPFPNEQAARAANGGALPPDMSVLAKARETSQGWYGFLLTPFTQYQEEGVDYIVGILNGYDEPPKDYVLPAGKYYNTYFPNHAISMPKPLSDGQVDYTDGSPKTVAQYSHDMAAFLMWTAEPKLDQRKSTGLTVIVFLAVFAGLLYAIKRRIWAGLHDVSGTPIDHRA